MTEQSGPGKAFHAIEPDSLHPTAIIAQALDNQWMPESAMAKAAREGWRQDDRGGVIAHVQAELRRALVNSRELVVNRAFLINNSGVSANYVEDSPERSAFLRLLSRGAIVPYLYNEQTPLEEPNFDVNPIIMDAWRSAVTAAIPSCVRFSWDDEANREATSSTSSFFRRTVQGLNQLESRPLARDLGISLEQAQNLKLGILSDIARWMVDQPSVTRNLIYRKFFVRADSGVQESVFMNAPNIVEARQLVDLVYNVSLPDQLGRAMLTPQGSPQRGALQELKTIGYADPDQLITVLRGLALDLTMRDVVAPATYGSLSLANIADLREYSEWSQYMTSVEGLVTQDLTALTDPDVIVTRMREMAVRHKKVLRVAGDLARTPAAGRRELAVLLALETPAAIGILYADGTPHMTVAKVAALAAAAIPLTVKIYLLEKGSGRAALNTSFVLQRLRLRRGARDWESIVRGLTGLNGFALHERNRLPPWNGAEWDDSDDNMA